MKARPLVGIRITRSGTEVMRLAADHVELRTLCPPLLPDDTSTLSANNGPDTASENLGVASL